MARHGIEAPCRFVAAVAGLGAAAILGSGLIGPSAMSLHAADPSIITTRSCSPHVSLITRGYGSPDDVAVNGKTILFGDIHAGVISMVRGGRKTILFRGLNVPEGIAVLPGHRLAVVEQGLNRIDVLNLRSKRRRVLLNLRNNTGLEGVDGISRVGGDLIIPDSPYGTLYRFHRGELRLITAALSRPVDAVAFNHGLAVADENANAVWMVWHGPVRSLARLSTPDDVAVAGGRLFAVTLGDNALWEVRPHLVRLARFGDPQGLAVLNSGTLVVADSTRNSLYRVSLSKSC